MSRYRKVACRIWSDEKFRKLTAIPPCGQGLLFYLLTGPHTGPIPGLSRAGRAAMAEDLGWSLEDFDEALAEVFREGIVKADFEAKLVWLPKALKHNKPESANVIKSWRTELDLLPECDLKREAINSMGEYLKDAGDGYLQAFYEILPSNFIRPKASGKTSRKPSRRPSGKACTNQEQEQERERKREEDAQAALASKGKVSLRSKEKEKSAGHERGAKSEQSDNPALQGKVVNVVSAGPDWHPELFEDAWQRWPKKQGYTRAKEIWNDLRLEGRLMHKILQDVLNYKRFGDWKKDDGRYCPKLENYLLQKGWLDDPPKPKMY